MTNTPPPGDGAEALVARADVLLRSAHEHLFGRNIGAEFHRDVIAMEDANSNELMIARLAIFAQQVPATIRALGARLAQAERERDEARVIASSRFELMRQYGSALTVLKTFGGLSNYTETRVWRALADEIDCGALKGECEYSGRNPCPRDAKDARCGYLFAEDLRNFADAIDTWRTVSAEESPNLVAALAQAEERAEKASTVPPHFKPRDGKPWNDRHPASLEGHDPSNDTSGELKDASLLRLQFASDLADPRAPNQMALVWRIDLARILSDYVFAKFQRDHFRARLTTAHAALAAAREALGPFARYSAALDKQNATDLPPDAETWHGSLVHGDIRRAHITLTTIDSALSGAAQQGEQETEAGDGDK